MSIGIVSPREAQALIAQGAKLIDVRDADEYLREHIPHAQLAPLSRLEQGDLPANLRAEQIIFHCQSGKRTSSNAAKLQAIADAPRDKCAHFREINGIAAAFQHLQKNYIPAALSFL